MVIVVILLIVGGAWWYSAQTPAAPTQQNVNIETGGTSTTTETGSNTPPGTETPTGGGAAVGVSVSSAPMNATVTYSDAGFSPSTVTIRKGGTVTWVNESSGNMWVASAQHPTHTAYNGTSRHEHCGTQQEPVAFDQCRGETGNWTFTFGKTGTWAYHDHINASRFGRVEVVE